jgi:alkylation response protein AidB-like acyl-CoA dehydrogenase
MQDPLGYAEPLWRRLAEVGFQGLTIDQRFGGQGLGMVELALVLEEMGRAVYPGPFFASVVLGGSAIAASGDEQAKRAYLPSLASGERTATLAVLEDSPSWTPRAMKLSARADAHGWRLDGLKRFVPFAHVADLILVAARTSDSDDPAEGVTLFVVERGAPGLRLEPNVEMDLTSRTATLHLDDVHVSHDAVLGEVDAGWPMLRATLQRAAVAASAEMLGAARKSLEMSVEHAKVREQFGQPIGAFQAIKHMCAEMLMDVETAHGATYYAAWALDAEAPDAVLAASVAKAHVGDAARRVCGAAVQVHGGIGFTWEYDLHLYFKRAKHLEALYGDSETHREIAAQHMLQVVEPREPVRV